MRYLAGKSLEMVGMLVVLGALIAGMGLADGRASMGKEMFLLGAGGIVFTMGWLLEKGGRTQ